MPKGGARSGAGGGGDEEEEEEDEDEPEEASKRGAPVGGYRENEARHRVPHGPFSRHEARQRPQQLGPERWGPRHGGPVLATETTTGASLTRDSHTSEPPEP